MTATVSIIVWRRGEEPHEESIPRGEGELHAMQQVVGGLIEAVARVSPGLVLMGNDTGALDGLPCRWLLFPGCYPFRVYGDVFLTRADGEGETVDTTPEDFALVKRAQVGFAMGVHS